MYLFKILNSIFKVQFIKNYVIDIYLYTDYSNVKNKYNINKFLIKSRTESNNC